MQEKNQKQLKSVITNLLEINPDLSCTQIAETAKCTPRYVAMVKAEIKRQRDLAKQQNFGIPVYTEKKALIAADIHAPYHVPKSLDAFLNFGAVYSPDILVLLGDLLDCYSVSYWRKDPGRLKFPDELEKALEVLELIDSAFPDSEKVLIAGNHENRLPSYISANAPALSGLKSLELTELLQLDERGWQFVDNIALLNIMELPFNIGNLYFLHGHELKVTMNSVNIPRNYFYKTLVPLCVAHHHTTQEFRPKRLDHSYAGAFSIGCLCQLSADFQPVTNWNYGFATAEFDADGDFAFRNRRIIGKYVE